MELTYIIEKDIVARQAANLVFNLQEISDDIHIGKNNKCVSGKSLVGILQSGLRYGDKVKVFYNKKEETFKIKEIFNSIGKEVL